MRLLALAVFVAVTVGGCAHKGPVNTTPQRRVVLWQVASIVHVINNCSPLLDLERRGLVEINGLPYGESAQVPLVSTPFSGSSRRMFLVAKGYTEKLEYLGSATRQFSVSTSRGSQEKVWEVNKLRLPGGRGGCQ